LQEPLDRPGASDNLGVAFPLRSEPAAEMIDPDLSDDSGRGRTPAGAAPDPADGMEVLIAALRDRRPDEGCFIIGVTGAVASGKSTLSAALATRLAAWPGRPVIEQACTDGFLHPNAVLDTLGLTARKGFPESYDAAALRRALGAVRRGRADFPSYSHVTYDVDPALLRRIESPDILIVEGLGLNLEPAPGADDTRPVDTLIYLDAEEADIEQWFVGRFLGLWAAAEHDPASFYARFRSLDRDQVVQLARTVWAQVNLPNLRDHIVKARDVADIVVRKRPDHAIDTVTLAAGR
jgi:type I pantothenate kinase